MKLHFSNAKKPQARTRSGVDVFVREIEMRMKKRLDYQVNKFFTKGLGELG